MGGRRGQDEGFGSNGANPTFEGLRRRGGGRESCGGGLGGAGWGGVVRAGLHARG